MVYNILLAVGCILLIISLYVLKGSISFFKKSEKTIGKVIEVERISGNDGATYKPVFKFKTSLNKEVIFRYPFSSSPSSFNLDEEATIAYDPNNPDNAKVLTYFGSFGLAVILLAIAMPLIVIGGGYHLSQYFFKTADCSGFDKNWDCLFNGVREYFFHFSAALCGFAVTLQLILCRMDQHGWSMFFDVKSVGCALLWRGGQAHRSDFFYIAF